MNLKIGINLFLKEELKLVEEANNELESIRL